MQSIRIHQGLVTFVALTLFPFLVLAQNLPESTYECHLALSKNPGITAQTFDGQPLYTSQKQQETLFYELMEELDQSISLSSDEIDKTVHTGVSNYESYRIGYKRIWALFGNSREFFGYMAKIETEFRKEKQVRPEATELEILESVLKHYEQLETVGFGEVIVLENKNYSNDEWYEMLRRGRPFLDTAFDSGLNKSREGHGYYTHRIQWMVVIFDYLEKGPETYGNLTPSELFIGLGTFTNFKLGGKDLWQHLFDSLDDTLRRPERIRSLHGFWPYMLGWH